MPPRATPPPPPSLSPLQWLYHPSFQRRSSGSLGDRRRPRRQRRHRHRSCCTTLHIGDRPQLPMSGSHSALPSGMASCLVEPPAGPGQRARVPRHPGRDALRAGPGGPYATSRDGGVGPSTAVRVGVLIRVKEPPPCRRALGLSRSSESGSDGGSRPGSRSTTSLTTGQIWSMTPTNPVTWPPPCRGASMAPTVTARLEWRIRRTVPKTVPVIENSNMSRFHCQAVHC
jgi:hypothetical protein